MVRWIPKALAIYLCWSFASHAAAAPTIGAYYYPWWGVGIPGGHTFEQILRTHLTPQTQPPAVGLHNSRDANVIAAHIDHTTDLIITPMRCLLTV